MTGITDGTVLVQAKIILDTVLRRAPRNVAALEARAVVYLQAGAHHSALADVTAAIDHLHRTRSPAPQRNVHKATTTNSAVTVPDHEETLSSGANERFSSPRTAATVMAAKCFTTRGVVHMCLHDLASAARDFRDALQVDDACALACFNAAIVYAQREQFAQAARFLDQAASLAQGMRVVKWMACCIMGACRCVGGCRVVWQTLVCLRWSVACQIWCVQVDAMLYRTRLRVMAGCPCVARGALWKTCCVGRVAYCDKILSTSNIGCVLAHGVL